MPGPSRFASLQCYTQESCFLGNIFSADHVQVVPCQRLEAILAPLSSTLFGCGYAALRLCVEFRLKSPG
jgi:hypothetical protein